LQRFSLLQSAIIGLKFLLSLCHIACEYIRCIYYKTFELTLRGTKQPSYRRWTVALLMDVQYLLHSALWGGGVDRDRTLIRRIDCAMGCMRKCQSRKRVAPDFIIAIDQLLIGPGCGRDA
jgi:hypothetical protein